ASRRRVHARAQRDRCLRARACRSRSPRSMRRMRRPGPAAAPRGRLAMSHRVRVNPIACDAHGLCAELLPERIELDDWGYPIVDSKPLEPHLVEMARRAAQACPTFALLVERSGGPAP